MDDPECLQKREQRHRAALDVARGNEAHGDADRGEDAAREPDPAPPGGLRADSPLGVGSDHEKKRRQKRMEQEHGQVLQCSCDDCGRTARTDTGGRNVMTRDEFVQRMKAELDRWNAQFGEWEKKTREAQAGLREHYERHLDMLARQRAEAARRLEEAQRASAAAWA